jgi:hypothetical protein
MKTFLFSMAFGIATLLATISPASACHHGCYRPQPVVIYVPQNPVTPVNPPVTPINPTVNPPVNPPVNGGQSVNGGNKPVNDPIEWDLPAEEKARIREAARGAVAPKPTAVRPNGQGGNR